MVVAGAVVVMAGVFLLLAPIDVELSVTDIDGWGVMRIVVLFWRVRVHESVQLAWEHLHEGGPHSSGVGPGPGASLGSMAHGVRIYRAVAIAVATTGVIRQVRLVGQVGLGDPAKTALAVGWLNAIAACRFTGVDHATLAVAPSWGPFRITGEAVGIFRWRGVDIMVAVWRTLRTLGILFPA